MDNCSTFCRNFCGSAGDDGIVAEDGGKDNNDPAEMINTENLATRQGNDHQAKLTTRDDKEDNVEGGLHHSSKTFKRKHNQCTVQTLLLTMPPL